MQNWNEIVRDNAAVVHQAAVKLVGNGADAEDISQEVFVEVFRKFQSGEVENWPALLRRVVVFRAIDFLRAKKNVEPLAPTLVDHAALDPMTEATERETQIRLRTAIVDLPTRQAQVFCLVYFEHQSHFRSFFRAGDFQAGCRNFTFQSAHQSGTSFRDITTGELR